MNYEKFMTHISEMADEDYPIGEIVGYVRSKADVEEIPLNSNFEAIQLIEMAKNIHKRERC